MKHNKLQGRQRSRVKLILPPMRTGNRFSSVVTIHGESHHAAFSISTHDRALRLSELSVSQTRVFNLGPFPEMTVVHVGRLNLLVLSNSWFIAYRRSLSLSLTSLF